MQARTKDDALITVKTMIFFELRDIETMLNQTADPIADFIKLVRSLIITLHTKDCSYFAPPPPPVLFKRMLLPSQHNWREF